MKPDSLQRVSEVIYVVPLRMTSHRISKPLRPSLGVGCRSEVVLAVVKTLGRPNLNQLLFKLGSVRRF